MSKIKTVLSAAFLIICYESLMRYFGRALTNFFSCMFGDGWLLAIDAKLGNPLRYASFMTFYNRLSHFLISLIVLALYYLLINQKVARDCFKAGSMRCFKSGLLWGLLWAGLLFGALLLFGQIKIMGWSTNVCAKLFWYIPFFALNTFAEELVFRGLILPTLLTNIRPAWAIVLTASAFSAAHYAGIALFGLIIMFNSLAMGLILGLLAYCYQSFWVAFACHLVNNYLVNRLISNNGSILVIEDVGHFEIAVSALVALLFFMLILVWFRKTKKHLN